eukprot:GHRQ01032795.1.p1 GENE.GHRQ01032795.1~~GHRQ01032795.1.p1  ORF type:complete len:159 (+),score=30.02 GHRQ01032795.1:170-646(+)
MSHIWHHHIHPCACRCFEDILRRKVGSPNALMESLHLKRFADEGSSQAMTAADRAAADAAAQLARRAAIRDGELGKLAAARANKSLKLQRDEAVHAALIKHQVGWCLHSCTSAAPYCSIGGVCRQCNVQAAGASQGICCMPATRNAIFHLVFSHEAAA